MKTKQQYVPYWEWEDYKNGMWRKLPKEDESNMLTKCIEFTGDWRKYGEAMRKVIEAWPKTMLNSLSNKSQNRRAFVGHCACSFEFDCPEYITRQAWKELTNQQRFDADKIAEYHIKTYENQNRAVHKNMARQMLFEWATRRTA
jgi:hypothetical protein